MAKKIQALDFDLGIVEYKVNGKHILRINPADFNMAARFMQFSDSVASLKDGFGKAGDAVDRLSVAQERDAELKQRLAEVFPEGNDFDQIFEGVNVMTLSGKGQTVLECFLEAIAPVIEEHTGQRLTSMQERAKQAAAKAATNRKQRRAASQ